MKRALFFALLLAGCAGAPQPEVESSSTAEPERDVAGYEARIAELERELARELPAVEVEALHMEMSEEGAGESSRCSVAADLRDRICDLAERICALAERSPHEVDIAGKCDRGRASCSDARARVAHECSGR